MATPAFADFAVRDGALVDGTGTPFVARGVNLPHAWTPEHTDRALIDIAATGANTVRVALGAGVRYPRTSVATVARLIGAARANRQTLILEVHDATGWPEAPRAARLSDAVRYWISIRAALVGAEDTVLINIANEPFAGPEGKPWRAAHADAIRRLRRAGLRHTFVVDAPGWGQDPARVMRSEAPAVFRADPLKNVVFSVHVYESFATEEAVRVYFESFRAARLPLLVGEFGPEHHGKAVAAEAVFALSPRYRIGWIAWAWSGNGPEARALDLVEGFDPRRPTPWGRRVEQALRLGR